MARQCLAVLGFDEIGHFRKHISEFALTAPLAHSVWKDAVVSHFDRRVLR